MKQIHGESPSELPVDDVLSASIEEMKRTIGANIKIGRKAKKLSQQQLSDICGLHRTYISDLENAKCNPTLNVLMVVADRLDLSLNKLLGI